MGKLLWVVNIILFTIIWSVVITMFNLEIKVITYLILATIYGSCLILITMLYEKYIFKEVNKNLKE